MPNFFSNRHDQVGAALDDGLGLLAGRLGLQQRDLVGMTARQAAKRFQLGVELGGRGIVVGEQRGVPLGFEHADLAVRIRVRGAGVLKPVSLSSAIHSSVGMVTTRAGLPAVVRATCSGEMRWPSRASTLANGT